jgi:hypothetical protein
MPDRKIAAGGGGGRSCGNKYGILAWEVDGNSLGTHPVTYYISNALFLCSTTRLDAVGSQGLLWG